MSTKISYIRLSPDQQKELAEISTVSGWRVMSRADLPSVFPVALREKLDSAVLMVSSSVRGTTTLVCNASRVDARDRAIDQEPFAVIVYPAGTSTGGIFVHHGEWLGRTSLAPPDFWQEVQGSGIGNYFLSHPPAGVTGGALGSLPVGQKIAFDAIVSRLKAQRARK